MGSPEELGYRLLTEYTNGFLVSKVMFTACELGVFDLLEGSGRPLGSEAIADRLAASRRGMELLLDTCVGLKLLHRETDDGKALYHNTALATLYLTQSGPKSQYHMLLYYSKTTYVCWNYLTEAVREGKNQYLRAFGKSSQELFEAIYRSEEELLTFMSGLNEMWRICGEDVIASFDLAPFPLICDLGGGSGSLARECVSQYPNCSVTIFDLPEAVQVAKRHFGLLEEQRISFQAGDFFKESIPEADLYILARVLHDWGDEKCLQLLSKIREAGKPGCGLLVVETILDEDKTGPLVAQLYSVNMLVQTEGRERTTAEYRELLAAAGFSRIQVKRTGNPYDAILGRK
ncbi:acetylserotonin O-methyltransferase isoform X1 [Ornithorhynchus anatinus]|uniref:acetylserotonin O-methyltransferase isoform X1 n=1 Tax=Ornithorhynchus anatinus TaxID=9258 RepID=UPI000155D33A|nr:acetylserotonin O-methyltransferase isoform X1 [Ornithorhynchus anatinus]